VCSLSRHSGSRGGITAGQAWESESEIDVSTYHAAKTGSLFEAAVELGALCGGAEAQTGATVNLLVSMQHSAGPTSLVISVWTVPERDWLS